MSENTDKPEKDTDKNLILDDERDLLMDHEYDGIQELDNNMPPWWLYGFYFTIVLSVVYLLYYEVTGWGPSQEEEYEMELAAAAERYGVDPDAPVFDFAEAELMMDTASLERGRELFTGAANQCATCHGQQGQGLVGPDLTNEYWKHGCDFQSVITSIREGFPSRGMPPYGTTRAIEGEDVVKLASYIISIRGTEPSGAKAPDMSRSVRCEEEVPEDSPAE